MNRNYVLTALVFVLFASSTFAYDLSVATDKYIYSANESIYATGIVKQNSTAVSNVSVVFQAKDTSGTTASSLTLISNSTGQFNYTFSLSTTGNYTLLANASGDAVSDFIKVKTYAAVLSSTDKPTYTSGDTVILSVKVVDASGNGVASQVVSNNMRYANNNTLVSALSSCTTNTLGECSISFTAPTVDGQYLVESNNFEHTVNFVVGGFNALMKITPNVLGLNSEVVVRVTVKNANGNGVSASTRQLVITLPNATEYTVTSMTQAVDSSGTSVTGVYEDRYNVTGEGAYGVKATVTAQGSNVTRTLSGAFDVRGYVMDIGPWSGQSVFYPSSSVSLGVKLRNASSNDFISGKSSTILTGASVLDQSGQPVVVNISVSEFTTLSSYRVDFVLPSTATSGTYKLKVSMNDSVGTGSGTGYFTVQAVRATMLTLSKFNGSSKTTFIAGQPIVVKFNAKNASGAVNVTGITTYTIKDKDGNDRSSIFGTISTYTGGDGSSYMNLTAPNVGGDFRIRAKLTTISGTADAEGSIFVNVLGISVRPVSIGGGGGGFTPFGGAGYMFSFRSNDTIQLNITVTSASEKQEGSEFMGFGGGGTEMASGGGASVGNGLFGIGGGTAIQGAQVKISRIMNSNTDEDFTNSVSGTLSCVTDASGTCVVKLSSTTNGNNWTSGYYVVAMNASTSNNQSDDGKGFFEVRKYFVDVRVAANVQNNANSLGFSHFNSWFIGPNDDVNVTVSVREPGSWNSISNVFNVTILGFYYGGKIGEFISPPKLISGTTLTYNTSNASVTISAPSTGWKSGFYQIKISIKDFSSNQTDSGQGFVMAKIYDGFGFPINPTTSQQDFTARSNSNVTMKINVYDVQRHGPAANLTVTKNKILSFTSFPPSELSYDQNVTQGTTDASGAVIMTLTPPTGGWPRGNYLAVFDVTNGSVTDSVQGFMQVRNFFAELTTSKWQFSTNETVAYNVTIVSQPSWMRSRFGGCPAGDPGCSGGPGGGGGGPPPSGGGGGGSFAEPANRLVQFGSFVDIDGDGIPDINITLTQGGTNLSLANISSLANVRTQNLSLSRNVSCGGSGCVSGAISAPSWFESLSCSTGQLNTTNVDYKNITLNFSGPALTCLKTSNNVTYKIGTGPYGSGGPPLNMTIQFIQEVAGSIGGSTGITAGNNSGITYYNGTLSSIRVSRFDFATGETLLVHGTDYNVTSANGVIVGAGNITIPGTGGIKLKPFGTWQGGFYHVVAEFNTSDGTETAESGFQTATYSTSCYRLSYGTLQSGSLLSLLCSVTSPAGGNYANRVDVTVESIKQTNTQSTMSNSLWSAIGNHTDSSTSQTFVTLNQSLSTGFYEAVMKFNDSSDIKRYSVWFEIKDFEPQVFSTKWSYSASENVTLVARGSSGMTLYRVNITTAPSVYRYDSATWTKNSVSGVTVSTLVNTIAMGYINATQINLSKSGGWDDGQYQVILNVTRVNESNVPQGNPVEISAMFDVKLFTVYGYATQWSFHPKANVSISMFVGSSSGSRYGSNVNVSVTEVKNTLTGVTLTKGTDYTVLDNYTTPSTTGDVIVKIIPASKGLPIGSYKAKISVTDSVSGKIATSDVYFTVIAFYLSAYPQQYEINQGDNATIILSASSPSGNGFVNISSAIITSMQFCNLNYSCVSKSLSSFNYTYDSSSSRIFVNMSGIGQGWYSFNVAVNDTQNATATATAYFSVKSFAFSAFLPYPGGARSGSGYQINETMLLNVTGSLGVNVTNATVSYNDCTSSGCTYKTFLIQIGYNMTARNVMLSLTPANITPSILNNTWPVTEYAGYSFEVRGVKSGIPASTFSYMTDYFPRATATGPGSVSTSGSIGANVTAFVEPLTGQFLAGANITVTDVLRDTGSSLLPISGSKWNVSSKIANSTGTAEMIVQLNGSTWPSGTIRIRYSVVLGNATSKAEFTTAASTPSLSVSTGLTNVTGAAIFNTTFGAPFNVTLTLQNGATTDANSTLVVFTLPVHSTNGSATITNLTVLSFFPVNVINGNLARISPQFNATNITANRGNYTTQISISPPSPFPSMSSSLTFEVK